jgi:hypothetical protein
VEHSPVAERPKVEFKGFGFEDLLLRDVLNSQFGKIRLPGGRTHAGKLLGAERYGVIPVPMMVRKSFQLFNRLGAPTQQGQVI